MHHINHAFAATVLIVESFISVKVKIRTSNLAFTKRHSRFQLCVLFLELSDFFALALVIFENAGQRFGFLTRLSFQRLNFFSRVSWSDRRFLLVDGLNQLPLLLLQLLEFNFIPLISKFLHLELPVQLLFHIRFEGCS